MAIKPHPRTPIGCIIPYMHLCVAAKFDKVAKRYILSSMGGMALTRRRRRRH